MKVCRKCNVLKNESEFSIKRANKDGLDSYCKECNRKTAQEYRNKNPAKVKEISKRAREKNPEKVRETNRRFYQKHKDDEEFKRKRKETYDKCKHLSKRKSHERREEINALKTNCIKCGETRKYIIQFHHIDPNQKDFGIGAYAGYKTKELILNEIKKCVCLCSNCHDEFHYFYGRKPKNPIKDLNEYLGGNYYAETAEL